jgi:hypothetical protein
MIRDCKKFRLVKFSISALSLLTMTSVAMTSALAASPREDQTRYGLASGTGPLNTLLINGRPTTPKIAGNSALFVSKIGEVGDTDVLLLTSVGGEACEAQYSIVQVTSTGIKPPTTFFGNCATAKAAISGGKVTVDFPKNGWKYSKAPAEVETYDLATGTLKKNGKTIPSVCKLDDGVCQG